MKNVLYIILSGLLLLVLVVVLIGTLLPRTRTETKQCILNAPVDAVFAIVTNNQEWHYRSSLDDLEIVRTQGDNEEWEETTLGVTIRFRTLRRDRILSTVLRWIVKCSQGSGKQHSNRWKEVKPYSLQQKR